MVAAACLCVGFIVWVTWVFAWDLFVDAVVLWGVLNGMSL